MPTNLLEALLYIYLLFPGLAYSVARESHRPRTNHSAFRETTTVVLVSVFCVGVVFSAAVLVGTASEQVRAWLQILVLDSPQLVRNDSQLFFTVLIAALITTTFIGWILGGKPIYNLTQRLRDPNFDAKKKIDRDQTTWETLLTAKKGQWTDVSVKLKSGPMIEGRLYSYSGAIASTEWALTLEPRAYVDTTTGEFVAKARWSAGGKST